MPQNDSSLSQHVIRSDRCVECCRRQSRLINVEIGALLSGIASALLDLKRDSVLALVPVPAMAATSRGVATIAVISGEAAIAAAAVGGAVLLGTAVEFIGIASEKAAIDTMGVVTTAIQNYFDLRDQPAEQPAGAGPGAATRTRTKTKNDCEDCVKKRMLQSGNRRQRQRTKILRRL